MSTERLCLNCMAGYMTGKVCSHCKKPEGTAALNRPPDALPAGMNLAGGRYCLGRVVGKGGFGITYLAWDRKWNRRIVIKELYPQNEVSRNKKSMFLVPVKGAEEDFEHLKLRFSQEAQVLHTLQNYPEIVKVYHLFEEYGTVYYAMEYLEGENLGERLKRDGKMSWQQLEKPIFTVLRSLQILHEKGLFHRDISPGNLFVLSDGGMRLIDFGSVRSYVGSGNFTTILNACYAPNELYDPAGRQGPWSDVYSLSITLYHVMTGVLPPKAQDRIASMGIRGIDSAKLLSDLHPDAPGHVQRAVEKGMSLKIQDRWQSAAEFMKALYPVRPAARLACVAGSFQGREYPVTPGQIITVGRSPEAKIRYPENIRTISRNQCSFLSDNRGILYVKDDGSSNGTFVDGGRIVPGQWIMIKKNQIVRFASEVYQVR